MDKIWVDNIYIRISNCCLDIIDTFYKTKTPLKEKLRLVLLTQKMKFCFLPIYLHVYQKFLIKN